MTKIMPIHPPIPRGTVIGEQVGGKPLSETEYYVKCPFCAGYFDARDYAAVLDHPKLTSSFGPTVANQIFSAFNHG
jgi:hypothetical protein